MYCNELREAREELHGAHKKIEKLR